MSSFLAKVGRIFKVPPTPVPSPSASSLELPPLRVKTPKRTPGNIPLGRHWATNEFTVSKANSGLRLDRLITKKFDIPRTLLHKIMRKSMVWVDRPAATTKPGQTVTESEITRLRGSGQFRVQRGDVVGLAEVFLKRRQNPGLLNLNDMPEETLNSLREMILYKDENLIVINKPAGIPVHDSESKHSIHAYLKAFMFENEELPLIVHRLDSGTSGVLLLARTPKMARELALRFKEGTVEKRYWALVNGVPLVESGEIVTNIYRVQEDPVKMTSIADKRSDLTDEGKVAITKFRIKGIRIKAKPKRTKLALVEFQPATGRTHQLRVHAAEQLGTPILGDIKYSRHHLAPGPLHLHARELVLKDYPRPGKRAVFTAPPPAHFVETMTEFPAFLRTKPKFPKKKIHNLPNYIQ